VQELEAQLQGLLGDISILQRRLYGNRTEKAHTSENQLTFAGILQHEQALREELAALVQKLREADAAESKADAAKVRPAPKGRRDLSTSTLPRLVMELPSPVLEAQGGVRDGFEESYELMQQRARTMVLVKRRVKYRMPEASAGPQIQIAPAAAYSVAQHSA
jgi:hypothetical protein